MKVFLYIRVACADQLAAADQREELEDVYERQPESYNSRVVRLLATMQMPGIMILPSFL